ncbi:MAG: hypothetical protein J6S67_20125 [Methanobrevibacter sp.]|nr:hypothetical protein [Methanobrevibacter sp.]
MARYDTRLEDFTPEYQTKFHEKLRELGKTEEWGKQALTINPIDNWLQYGFNSFSLPWLQQRVDRELGANMEARQTLDDALYQISQLAKQLADLIDQFNELYQQYAENMDECERRLSALEAK